MRAYITGDHRTMLERPEEIIGGAKFLAKMFGVDKVVIGVEDNKRNGIDAMNKVIAEQKAPVVVEPCAAATPRAVRNSSARPSPAARCPPADCPPISLRRIQHQHHMRHLPGPDHRYARGAQDRHRLRLRRGGAQEPGVPHRHPRLHLLDACGGLKDGTYKLIAGGP